MTEKYSNPVPVAVALIPCNNKLVAIRRGIQPRLGEIAFPGGYISSGVTSTEFYRVQPISIPPCSKCSKAEIAIRENGVMHFICSDEVADAY